MRIRALSVFEGIVYHCWPTDRSNPARPVLEVEAVLRPGDADGGPLLLSVADYLVMVSDTEVGRRCVARFADEGRVRDHLGVAHLAFPFWTPVGAELAGPPRHPGGVDGDAGDRTGDPEEGGGLSGPVGLA